MVSAAFIYSDDYVAYKFSDRHPLQQWRLVMLQRLLAAYGVFERGECELVAPAAADPEDIRRVHSPEYLDVMRRLSSGEYVAGASDFGFGAGDNPPFAGMWEASLLYSGASMQAADLALSGRNRYAFNPSGGLHHAARAQASGFCLINDNVLAAQVALDRGLRVAYIDIDAHHGDGTQSMLYNDPRVLTVSIHETGRTLFPGTGFPDEIGEGTGIGCSINIPMAPYSGDAHYAFAFDAAVQPIVEAFAADFYILQAGADAHVGDPLTHLCLSSRGWIGLVDRVLRLAADKPLVVLGGGGYDLKATARLWTLLQARLSGVDLPDVTPARYAEEYGIAHLHDDSEDIPVLSPLEDEAVWEYVRTSVGELKQLVGDRYGL